MRKIVTDFLSGNVKTVCTQSRIIPTAGLPNLFDITQAAHICADSAESPLNFEGLRIKLPFKQCAFGAFFRPKDRDFLVLLNDNGYNIQGLALAEYQELPSRILGAFKITYDNNGVIQKVPRDTYTGYWTDYVMWDCIKNEDPDRVKCPTGNDFEEWEKRRSGWFEEIQNVTFASAVYTLFALSLLNCKNVSYSEIPCSPKLAKRFKERHGVPRPKQYTLTINPIRKAERHNSTPLFSSPQPLHICRGHFKNYDDKPLFGKLKGTYWWAPHTRGDISQGVIQKDYEIKLPQ